MTNITTAKYLIIGTSAAGLTAALELRKLDVSAQITCVTNEAELPYNKCFLVDYLAGDRTLAQVYLRTPEFLAQHNIEILYQTTVVEIQSQCKRVKLSSGADLDYDQLLLATGARAAIPLIPGLAQVQPVLNFYNLADTLKLETQLQSLNQVLSGVRTPHVTVIGAGLTGLECADALWRRGLRVTLIDQHTQVLARTLDAATAKFLQNQIASLGIELILGAQITAVGKSSYAAVTDWQIKIVLSSQREILTDLVILATGLQANQIMLADAELALVQQHIKVDQYFATNVAAVWAAGDAIIIRDRLTGSEQPNRTWPAAVLQGRLAARNMCAMQQQKSEQLTSYAGQSTYYKSHFFDLDFVVCGESQASQLVSKYSQVGNNAASYNYNVAQQLRGFVLLGDISMAPNLRRQIEIG